MTIFHDVELLLYWDIISRPALYDSVMYIAALPWIAQRPWIHTELQFILVIKGLFAFHWDLCNQQEWAKLRISLKAQIDILSRQKNEM